MKTLLLSLTILISFTTLAQPPAYVPTNGLVGWWPFNANANDESGNGNDGTVNGATLTTDRFGTTNAAYDFDGVDDEIVVNNSAALSLNETNDLSFSFWIQSNNNLVQRVLSKREPIGSGLGIEVLTGNDSISFYYGDGPSSYVWESISNNSIVSDSFVHVIVLVDQTSNIITSYINASIETKTMDFSGVTGTVDNLIDLSIGGAGGLGEPLKGKLDDLGIWNRLLDDCEIEELYTTENCHVGVPQINHTQKELIMIIDFMGRETEFKPNIPLIFIYSDGTRERVMEIEE